MSNSTISEFKVYDNPLVTTLRPESYNKWRSNSVIKIKEERNKKEKKKIMKPSYNFKLIHASSEYQDTYLTGKNTIKIPNKGNTKHESTITNNIQFDTDTKRFMEKIEKKANNFNPEINLFNIMKAVTKELDNDEDNKNLKERIHPANRLELLQRIKTQSLHTIQESVKQTEMEKIKKMTKNEIIRISNEMNYLLDKSQRENQSLQITLENAKKEADELKMENDKLIRRNQILTQNVKELSSKNEKLLQDIQKLESFKKSYNFFTEKFPNYSIEKFIDKFNYLENSCMIFSKRICDLEDDNRIIDQEKGIFVKKIEEINYKMDLKEMEKERVINKYQKENESTEKLMKDNEKFKDSYLELFRKILNIFSKWTEQIKIFYDPKNPIPPQANLQDPIEMLDILDKIINISTAERLQMYLRKIIVISNILQRKFFLEHVHEKFDPDKIFQRIITRFEKLDKEKEKLEEELKYYRTKYKSTPSLKKTKHFSKSESKIIDNKTQNK